MTHVLVILAAGGFAFVVVALAGIAVTVHWVADGMGG